MSKTKKTFKSERAIISRLKNKILKKCLKNKDKYKNFNSNTKFKFQNSKAIVTMQIQHKNRKPWTPEEEKKKHFQVIINIHRHTNTCVKIK